MSSHLIIQVRDAVIAKLRAGVSAVESRVYRFGEVRTDEVDEASCPYIVVQVGDDFATVQGVNGAPDTAAPQVLEEDVVTLFLHCCVKQTGDAEAAAYNLRRDVELVLFGSNANRTLDGTVNTIRRTAGTNNRDEATDLGVYSSVMQLEVPIWHLDSQPASFTY